MPSKTTWILVGDASRARLFEEREPGERYLLVESFLHPESRAHVVDLVTDANGRKPVGVSRGVGVVRGWQGGVQGRPGVAPETDPKEVEAQKFARELSAALTKGFDEHRYAALMLVAPPHFLGVLKDALGDPVKKHLESTLDKDLSALEPREIERRLRAQRAA
jgi:protein required for attachment to host cells